MSDSICFTPIHTAYHLACGASSLLSTAFFSLPIKIFEKIVRIDAGILREDNWIMIAARYDASKRRKGLIAGSSGAPGLTQGATSTHRFTDGVAFSSLDFFGFDYNADPLLREQWFSNERYPYPLYGGHFQTMFGVSRKSIPYKKMGYIREKIKSSHDGCDLVLEWKLCDPKKFPDGPKAVIAIVPGLSSTSTSNYIERFVLHAVNNGYNVVVVETRGVPHPLTGTGTTLGGCFTYDVTCVFEEHLTESYMEKRFGKKDLKLVAVGLSLGGSILCHALGKQREKSRLHCAMALCSPFDYFDAWAASSQPLPMALYQPGLARGLVKMVARNGKQMIEHTSDEVLKNSIEKMMKDVSKRKISCNSVAEFDATITCRVHGYANIVEYYSHASPFASLHKIEVPLLCLSTMDDMVVGKPAVLRRWDFMCDANPNLLYVRCPTGGHLGFARGPIDELLGRPSYLEERMIKALDVAIKQPTKVPICREVPDAIECYHLSSSKRAFL